jgi:tRNA pseudouridine38-40 synthase
MKKLLTISYDGTNYAGWQIQPNGLSIQEVLEEKIGIIYAHQKIRIESSGRTDAGVHAAGQTASYDAPERPLVGNDKIFRALNRMLPKDIRILEITDVPDSFHARFSAKGKTYIYVINNGTEDAFTARWSWHLPEFQNICEVRKAMSHLIGTKDFSSFTVDRKDIDNAERTVFRAEIREFGSYKSLIFSGNGFLYKMVRGITGTLAFVGSNKISAEDFKNILGGKNRCEAFDTAPPHGLFLVKVFYNENEAENFIPEKLPFLILQWES